MERTFQLESSVNWVSGLKSEAIDSVTKFSDLCRSDALSGVFLFALPVLEAAVPVLQTILRSGERK
jgi:hypothetical protein